jgi:hypothetical protein
MPPSNAPEAMRALRLNKLFRAIVAHFDQLFA